MILADTSIWADHFRRHDATLATLLDQSLVLLHPFVIGELALGYLKPRADTLASLVAMPGAVVATDSEALALIDRENLMGCGIGYIDVHLLASARLTDDTWLWTADKKLAATAARMGISFTPA